MLEAHQARAKAGCGYCRRIEWLRGICSCQAPCSASKDYAALSRIVIPWDSDILTTFALASCVAAQLKNHPAAAREVVLHQRPFTLNAKHL